MWPLVLLIIGIGGGGCALNTTGLYVPPDGSDDQDAVGNDSPPDAYDVETADADVDEYEVDSADADDVYVEGDGGDSGHCIGNLPPRSFHLLSPAPDETNVSTRTIFEWGSAIDPEGGDVRYNLMYDDDGNPATPARVVSDLSGTSYELSPADALPFGAIVAWSVTATDDCGNETEGISPRSFTTREYLICEKIGSDVRVTNAGGDSTIPSLTLAGSEYAVSWTDNRDSNEEIYFRRLDSSGTPIGSDLPVTDSSGRSRYPSIASNGLDYGIIWHDNTVGNYELYFRLVSGAGTLLGTELRVTEATADSLTPSLVWTGTEYGVSWHDFRHGAGEIYFDRISETGTLLASNIRLTNEISESLRASVVWNGSGYGVSWSDYRNANYEIYFNRISSTGTPLDLDRRITNSSGVSDRSSLVWSGSEYGLCWEDDTTGNIKIYFTTLSDRGVLLSSEVAVASGTAQSRFPSLVWNGTEYAIAWQDNRSGDNEIYFGRISEMGALIVSDIRITTDPGQSEYPRIISNGNEYAIAWQDNRNGNYEIYFALIGCAP
jgi:hypothetical protein